MSYRTLKKKLLKWFERKCLVNAYEGIDDLPISRWWKLNSGGDITLLLKKGKASSFTKQFLHKRLYDIMNQYSHEYGFSELYEQKIRRLKDIHGHYVKMIVNNDKTQRTFINILENEVKELDQQMGQKKVNPMETKAYLDKHFGFRIDPEVVTVREYMNYITSLEK